MTKNKTIAGIVREHYTAGWRTSDDPKMQRIIDAYALGKRLSNKDIGRLLSEIDILNERLNSVYEEMAGEDI